MTTPSHVFFNDVIDGNGQVEIDRLAKKLRVTKTALAFASGLSRDAISSPLRLSARATQVKLLDMVEILNRMLPWTGSPARAFVWYRTQPLASYGGRTTEDLVKEGRAEAVKAYFSRIAVGEADPASHARAAL